jgi:hypothetical protein
MINRLMSRLVAALGHTPQAEGPSRTMVDEVNDEPSGAISLLSFL